jgi:CRISPR system Cascade subunit CasA
VEKKNLTPQGYAELLTWQSRRVRLFHDGGRVTGAISSYGDVFEKGNADHIEIMSGWRVDSQKSQNHESYKPKTHITSRSMWRDLGALLPQADANSQTKRPGVLDWIPRFDGQDVKIEHKKINIHAVGYEYGAMQGIVNELISDSVVINARLLGELGGAWVKDINNLLKDTDEAVKALGRCATDLNKAAGGDGARTGENTKAQAYFVLDEPFRAWLAGITPDSASRLEIVNQWKGAAKRILYELGRTLINEAGDAAFVGRKLKRNGKSVYMNSAIAEVIFKAALKNIFGGET